MIPRAIVMASVLLLCAACGGKTWQATRATTPITYDRIDAPIERSVGKLRRLALLPAKIDVTLPLFEGAFSKKRTRAAQEQLAESWGAGTATFLTAAKGYEVVLVDQLREDEAALEALAAWAADGGIDQTPSPVTAAAVAALARRLAVDGFVTIRGLQRAPNVTMVLTVLTASLSWPLMFVESRQAYRAEIVEGASGRIVWRANVWEGSIGAGSPTGPNRLKPENLFHGLEHAVPRVLTE